MSKKLSKRLQMIADMVDENAYIADIGADHGHLPIYLIETGKISYAQAVENKMGPYLNLKHNVDASGLASHILVTLADGISNLSNGVDTLVLAGMGGRLSIDILAAHPENLEHIDTIILDPHRDLSKVRSYLAENGYHIETEKMIYEDKIYYSIIKAKKGAPEVSYTIDELRFGPYLMQHPDDTYIAYLEAQRKNVSNILNNNLSVSQRESYLELYRAIANQIKSYNEAK